jgi:predicted metal-binding transcription factor (methanogenesis marker protein 9)
MENRITNEELESLRFAYGEHNDNKVKLADVILSEEKLKTQKQTLFMDIAVTFDALKSCEKDITDKYGIVDIDLATGAYTVQ